MAQDWNIKPRGHVCSLCDQPLEDKKPCVSALRRDAAGGFMRMDCHVACWRDVPREWEPFSFWEGEYNAPPQVEEKPTLKKENADTLLRRLITLDDPALQNVVYVLAVMLERSKQLVERDAKPQEDGTILRVYEDRKTGDTVLVVDPRLRLDQLGEVQQQVVALLSGTATLGTVVEK